ncbi:MAG: hypothetical protein KAY37_15035 [Phycisphaerae bacterium]|nr:hypothetical protein [Phycisphaerae bacterium]
MRRIIGLLAILALVTPGALAEDNHPPDWRYQANTTYQAWEFDQDTGSGGYWEADDGWFGPGNPYVPGYGPDFYCDWNYDEWLSEYDGRNGVFHFDIPWDRISFNLWNWEEDPDRYKEIYIQITWHWDGTPAIPELYNPYSENTTVEMLEEVYLGGGGPPPDGWWYTWYRIVFPDYNPDYEQVDIWTTGAGLLIDEIVIDTICLGVCPGDSNCDNEITWRDIDYFVAAMNDNVAAWAAMFLPGTPSCSFANNDVNGDGTVNWRDIDPFVALMNTTCP